jgi:hypothetical protein
MVAMRLRRGFREYGDWTPPEALDVPAPPAETAPKIGQYPQRPSHRGSVEINDKPVETLYPPPPQSEDDYGTDDAIPF